MAIESSEIKFKFDKKGRLHVTHTEKEKTDAGDTVTYKSPEKHDLTNADEEAKKMLFDSLVTFTRKFLEGDPVTYFNKSKK